MAAKTAAILSAITSMLVIAFVAWAVHTYIVGRMEAKHKDVLAALDTKKDAECLGAKQLTYGVSDVYQKDRVVIFGSFDDYLLRSQLPITGSPANGTSGHHAGRPTGAVVSGSR
jgi:hypothetical protein